MTDAVQSDYYSDDVATLGERLGVARERAGLSQQELAEALAIKSATLSNWENDSSEPRSTRLTLIAGILGVSPGWLLNGIGNGVPAPDDAAEAPDDAALASRLLGELRETREMQERISLRMARIEDALVALKAA